MHRDGEIGKKSQPKPRTLGRLTVAGKGRDSLLQGWDSCKLTGSSEWTHTKGYLGTQITLWVLNWMGGSKGGVERGGAQYHQYIV